jgi:redox-sensitive bicupin YhaK (pirin superfamily)
VVWRKLLLVCAAQIWVNLPGRHKLTQPRIQLLGENVDGVGLGAIPVHSGDGYQVRYEMV